MWKLYEELLALVPADAVAERCLAGQVWMNLQSNLGSGLAMMAGQAHPHESLVGQVAGAPLRRFAERVTSFDLFTATAGMAAINSAINSQEYQQQVQEYLFPTAPHKFIFEYFEERMSGKKVALIGHLPGAEKYRDICDLTILERNPQQGDCLDSACEYLLPNQDYVFITATTIANKTLPRLLQLTQRACTVLWGPSAPLTPVLFRHGVDMVAGMVVEQADEVWRVVAEGGYSMDFRPYSHSVVLANPKTRSKYA